MNPIDYQHIIEQIHRSLMEEQVIGETADYIPELAQVNVDQMGIYVLDQSGHSYQTGDWQQPFSIQSVVKVLTLCMAYSELGTELWQRVGVEPSGTPFNSLGHLEHEQGVPRNPFSNAGALVICDVLMGLYEDPLAALLDLIRQTSTNPDIDVDPVVAESEKSEGHRNMALAYLMKSLGNISHDVDDLLDFYFNACSITLNCQDLAKVFAFLAHRGLCPQSNVQVLNNSQSKRINAIMLTCGFYDEAGDFAFRVGLPGKSGVSGAIVALLPEQFVVTTWSPGLNTKGNSHRGLQFLEAFTTETGQSIF